MKNLFRNIFLVSCLLLTVGAVEAQAQTAQTPVTKSLDMPKAVTKKMTISNRRLSESTMPSRKKAVSLSSLQQDKSVIEAKLQASVDAADISKYNAALEKIKQQIAASK